MEVRYKINLELTKNSTYEYIEAHRGDKNSRFIDCTLTNEGIAVPITDDITATYDAVTDDVIVANGESAEINTETNEITIKLSENMLSLPGIMKVDLKVSKDDTLITTQTFSVKVGNSAINESSKFKPTGGTLEQQIKNKLDDKASVIKTHHISPYAVITDNLADGAITQEKIEYGAVGENELATELLNLINSKLDESKIGSQISTITTNATSGSEVGLVVNDKKWIKDTIIKITVSADESLISGKMTLGVKYGNDTSYTQIATPLINEEVTYITTADTNEIGIYIPSAHVVGDVEVTLTVETLGLKSDVAMLFSDIVGILEILKDKANSNDVYSITESNNRFLTSVSTSNIANEAVTAQKLSKEIIETINSKLNSAEINSQTSTVVVNAVSGSQVALWALDKKWVKDTVVKITVSADESVISGKVTLGVKYDDDTNSTQIATTPINEKVTYLLTADTSEIGVYIPKENVVGNGEVTLTIESIGLRTEVVELKEKVSNIETDIDNLRNETPVAKSSIEGKTFSVIGDSCSAYTGWVPNNQKSYYGNSDENETDVTSVEQMWWYILSSQLNMSLLTNDSWMGTTISSTGYNGDDMTASAFTTRAKSTLCENNTTSIKPDYIFVFGGTNDKRADSPIGTTQYSGWDDESLKSVLPSFCKLIHDIKLYNPHATIINITFDELIGSGIDVGYAEACEYYGITNVVLSDIVQTDGHPTREAQFSIAEQVIAKLREIDSSIKTYIDVSEVGM